jgi:serine/threonine-protein kinase
MRAEGLHDPDARARFALEAKATVRLKSQHVARVIDVGTLDGGAPYLVMEFLDGCDVATVLEERGPLPFDEAVAYLLQVCEGVAEAHGLGIVHRDLKPRNLFIASGADGKPLLKVLDFGISKFVRAAGADDLALTKTTDVMGSPAYMAPEQLRAARNADERSDLWSLGVILYEMITARLPWEGASMTELGAMVLRDPPHPIRQHRPDTPEGLEQVVLKCLEKAPADRFASVEELAHALEPYSLGLAVGAASRVASVARSSRRPAASRPSISERASSSSRVMVSGGTSVSWGETEPMVPRPSLPPKTSPRTAILAAVAVAALVTIGTSVYGLARRGTPSVSSPGLPEDRGAILPPAPAPLASAATPSLVASSPAAVVAGTAEVPPTSLAAIPRKAPLPSGNPARQGDASVATRSGLAAPPPAPAPAPAPPAPAPATPDAHNIGAVGRK